MCVQGDLAGSRVVIMPRTQAQGGPVDIQVYGKLAQFMGGEEEQPANRLCGAIGSWGRDRTADLWVMNPPL